MAHESDDALPPAPGKAMRSLLPDSCPSQPSSIAVSRKRLFGEVSEEQGPVVPHSPKVSVVSQPIQQAGQKPFRDVLLDTGYVLAKRQKTAD
jgi:hypothetical protein